MPGHSAGSGPGGAGLVGVEPEQEAESQRIGEDGDRPAGLRDFDSGQRAERELADVIDLVDDGQRSIKAIADQHRVVALDDGGGDPPTALAGVTEASRHRVEVLAPDDGDHLARRRGAAEFVEAAQPPSPHAGPGRRRARRTRNRRALERQLLDPAQFEQVSADGMKLGQERELGSRSDPPLGPLQQLGNPYRALGRPLCARGRAAPDEQPRGVAPGFDPRDSDFGRRVADVDAGDQHPLVDSGGAGH